MHLILKHFSITSQFHGTNCIVREWCVTGYWSTYVKMAGKKEQHVDPWTAEAAEGESSIDYNKLIGTNLPWSLATVV